MQKFSLVFGAWLESWVNTRPLFKNSGTRQKDILLATTFAMASMSMMEKLGLPPFLQGMNSTSLPFNSSAGFPSGIMDTFLVSAGQASPLLQLFLFVYRFIGAQLGLDPSILLTFLGCLWGLSKLFDQVYALVDYFISLYFRCTICVSETDQMYTNLMQFLSEQQDIATNRHLTAQTVFKSAWDEEEDSAKFLATTSVDDEEDSPKYLNFASQAARCVSF